MATRAQIDARIQEALNLGDPQWDGADSTVWTPDHMPGRVVKVCLLNRLGVIDHKVMVEMGEKFPHVAQVFVARPICTAAEISSMQDPWFYCLIIQDYIDRPYTRNAKLTAPGTWVVDGQGWRQNDQTWANQRDGKWVDTARINRLRKAKNG